ncbi:unnamed protein product [Rotaria socialis]
MSMSNEQIFDRLKQLGCNPPTINENNRMYGLAMIYNFELELNSDVDDMVFDDQDMEQKLLCKEQQLVSPKTIYQKNNEDLERYRDPDGKENFRDTIPFDDRDLLEVPARNAAEYAQKLLQEMFKPDELESSLLPSPLAKRFSKVEQDQNRFNLLNGTAMDL